MNLSELVTKIMLGGLKNKPEKMQEFVVHEMLAEPAVDLMVAKLRVEEALEGMGCTKERAAELIEAELNEVAEAFEKWLSTKEPGPKARVFINNVEVTHYRGGEPK